MQLRRVLLLFAIVLGMAALVASLARPPEGDRSEQPAERQRDTRSGPPTATTRPVAKTVTITFTAGGRPEMRRLRPGQPATVVVEVGKPGEVTIPSLGLLQPAEPLTPARFDVFAPEPGRHQVKLDLAASDRPPASVGVLRVVAPPRKR